MDGEKGYEVNIDEADGGIDHREDWGGIGSIGESWSVWMVVEADVLRVRFTLGVKFFVLLYFVTFHIPALLSTFATTRISYCLTTSKPSRIFKKVVSACMHGAR